MSVRFEDVEARVTVDGEIGVSWRLVTDGDDLEDVRFEVQRSGGVAGPYSRISPLLDAAAFLDDKAPLKHQFRRLAYRVRAILANTGEEAAVSGPVEVTQPADLVGIEIVRQFRLLLQRFTGTFCAIFSIRDFGPRCSCFNVAQKRLEREDCPKCFGVGFRGGYFAQVNAFVDFEPPQESVEITQFGEMQTSETLVWLTNFPPVKPRDVIVAPDNRRWNVVSVRRISRLGFVVQQFLKLRIIQGVDIEYQIPVEPLALPDDVFRGLVRVGGSLR